MTKKFLVTGSSGFVGFHLCQKLLEQGHTIVGVDNLNSYYSQQLKEDRTRILKSNPKFSFFKNNIEEKDFLRTLFQEQDFDSVFHLAAQAGVRYSLDHPETYLKSNIDGTLNVLEGARFSKTKPHLLMASSSSVYGLSKRYPFREDDPADQPVALYGATKRANEHMGHAYAHLFGLRVTMLRFFTVYGPWGRPDMALFKFVKNISRGEEIEVYNNGDMVRDFTYVDDIVSGIIGLEASRLQPEHPLFEVFNIGCARPKTLMEFIAAIEDSLGKKAKMKMLPFQPGDVHKTVADVTKIQKQCGYQPKTEMRDGVKKFVDWYLDYYKKESSSNV